MRQTDKLYCIAFLPIIVGNFAFTTKKSIEESGLGGQSRQPNILFIVTDQWRKQALGLMKEDKVLTPNLDRLASQGAVFRNAYSTVAVCSPNRACLLTGQYAMHHGVLANDTWLMPEKATLGDICKANGYQTAYLGKWHIGQTLRDTAGMSRGYVPPEYRHGFDYWYKEENHIPFDQPTFIGDSRVSVRIKGWEPDNLVAEAVKFLKHRDPVRPFCMVLSFGPPHTGGGTEFGDRNVPGKHGFGYGYAAPFEYEKHYIPGADYYQRPVRTNVLPISDYEKGKCVQGYFGAITAIDEALGRLFDELNLCGLDKNTVVVFTSDHGEMMGSHGRMTKGVWFQESAGIPLIVRGPSVAKGKDYACVINSIDLLPTILGLCGLPVPSGVDGTDFTPLLRGEAHKTPEHVFCSFYQGSNHYRAVHTERYTYVLTDRNCDSIAGSPEVLYDLRTDPYETKPIVRGQGQDALLDHFRKVLKKHLRELNDPFLEKVWAGGPGSIYPDYSTYLKIEKAAFPGDPNLTQNPKN